MKKNILILLLAYQISLSSSSLLLNEYNGVGSNYKLKNQGYDTFYGRINGNGGSWLEMVVVKDKIDIQNATINIDGHANTHFVGKLPNFYELSNLREGTILTISDEPTDLSYDPFSICNPDWTININSSDLIVEEGTFDINNNELKISIKSSDNETLMEQSGEGVIGGRIDKKEVFKLKKEPSSSINPNDTAYGDDLNRQIISTFGEPNQWIDDLDNTQKQNLSTLRSKAKENYFKKQKASLVLNEYNGVSSDNYLKLNGSDSYFGQIEGNGGSWMELVVTRSHLNLHNAKLTIKNSCNQIFSAKLPEFTSLGYLREGSILTISDEPTDMTYFPFSPYSDDWKLNINIDDLQEKSGTFRLDGNMTTISIVREDGQKIRLSTSGEGVGDDILDNQEEIYKLKANPDRYISPYNINYGDDNDGQAISTFGAENRWLDENGTLKIQKMILRENDNLNETGGIDISNNPDLSSLKDTESLLYIPQNDSLWIADDDGHQVFEMDFTTHEVKSKFTDVDLGTFTNGDINDHCNSSYEGVCDIEEIAYKENSDTLYIFAGHSRGTPSIFKLSRENIDDKFSIESYRKLDSNTEYPSAIVIDNDLIVSIGKSLYKYDYETNSIDSLPLFTIDDDVGEIVGLAYLDNILWVTTLGEHRLIKVNWSSKNIEHIYKMTNNGVSDPRGVEIIDNKLYIVDGNDNVEPHHVLKHAIHIYQVPN
ncbi:MAG TPA: hypothetical protein ENK88_09370 [Campylobacterales bacterium]|nr:hypothetical protein [Campylobacterales bacterium]